MLKKNNRVKIAADAELKERLVAINRTTKVTKGGRTFTFAAIVVVGDGNGVIGYGLGKANEVTTAISKGTEVAKKNLIKVPVHRGTIPHEVVAKFGGSRIRSRLSTRCAARLPWLTIAASQWTRCLTVNDLFTSYGKDSD